MSKKEHSVELTRMLARLEAENVGTLKDYKELSQEERAIYLEGLDKLQQKLGERFHKTCRFRHQVTINYDKDGNPK